MKATTIFSDKLEAPVRITKFHVLLAAFLRLLVLTTSGSLPNFDYAFMTADKQVGYVPELGWAPPQVHLLAIADGAFRERYAPLFYNMGGCAQRHGYKSTLLSTNAFDGECEQYRNMFCLGVDGKAEYTQY
jgi:hypothetical protein